MEDPHPSSPPAGGGGYPGLLCVPMFSFLTPPFGSPWGLDLARGPAPGPAIPSMCLYLTAFEILRIAFDGWGAGRRLADRRSFGGGRVPSAGACLEPSGDRWPPRRDPRHVWCNGFNRFCHNRILFTTPHDASTGSTRLVTRES